MKPSYPTAKAHGLYGLSCKERIGPAPQDVLPRRIDGALL
jgi:hypothetical protein